MNEKNAYERAKLQIAIGEKAHGKRADSSRNDWVDAAHFVLQGGPIGAVTRVHYEALGVVWSELRAAAVALGAKI